MCVCSSTTEGPQSQQMLVDSSEVAAPYKSSGDPVVHTDTHVNAQAVPVVSSEAPRNDLTNTTEEYLTKGLDSNQGNTGDQDNGLYSLPNPEGSNVTNGCADFNAEKYIDTSNSEQKADTRQPSDLDQKPSNKETADPADLSASTKMPLAPTSMEENTHYDKLSADQHRSLGVPQNLFSSTGDMVTPSKAANSSDFGAPCLSESFGSQMPTHMGSTELHIPPAPVTPATVDSPPAPPQDLVEAIPGLYRILDLVSEHGSGGLGM